MNDFTKEELQIILLDMDTYIGKSTILKESPSHRRLRLKIQAMIEWHQVTDRKRCGLGECNNYPEECLRCNK